MTYTIMNRIYFPVLSVIILTFALTACTKGPMSALSTGASMRVEVDVYKGPLSKDKEVQLGELMGIVKEAQTALMISRNSAHIYHDKLGCLVTNKSRNCRDLQGVISSADNLINETERLIKKYDKCVKCVKSKNECDESERGPEYHKNLLNLTEQISSLAVQYKAKAFFWTEAQIKDVSSDEHVRAKMTDFTTLTSEYSRQIASRAAVLYKQYKQYAYKDDQNQDNYLPGQRLAVSDHLRDASPTMFLNLYDWYQATYKDSKIKTGLNVEDRVRMGKMLFDDHYWTQINEVHASGQGDVSMALIKDDIGNWNLKSFKNNPTELLGAYRDLSLAGIEAATRVAKAIATRGGSEVASEGASLLDLSSNFALGRVGSARTAQESNIRISALHNTAADELEKLSKENEEEGRDLVKEFEDKRGDHDKVKKEREELEKEIKEKESEIGSQNAELIKIQKKLDELDLELTELKSIPEDEQTEADKETIERLEEEKQKLSDNQKAENDVLKQMKADLILLEDQDSDLLKAEEEAKEDLDGAEKALTAFASRVINEARDVLIVHRRVIDALKTAQIPLDQ